MPLERRPIRAGIIGMGRMGQLRNRLIADHPDLELKAVCDISADRLVTSPGVKATTDYQALLDCELDAVFVCTPNAVTADIVTRALARGLHVFCEKPPGRCLEDIQRIREAEQNTPRLKLKFGFNHRYHDSVREALRIIRGGQLGAPMWIRGVYGKSGGREFEKGWRSRQELAGGGILLDQGIHMLDLFRMFMGDFEEVKSFVERQFWTGDVEDSAFALLRTSRGQVAALHSSSTHWKHCFLLEVSCTKGYLILQGLLTGSRSYGRETLVMGHRQFEDESFALGHPREEVIYFDRELCWQREVEDFAHSLLLDQPIQDGNSWDALQVMRLIDLIYGDDAGWLERRASQARGVA